MSNLLKSAVQLCLLFLFTTTAYSADYVISKDFDLIYGVETLHTVRIYALTDEATSIAIRGQVGSAEVLTEIGTYKDFSLPAGAVVSADRPVAVIKYDSDLYSWIPTYAGSDVKFDLAGNLFYLVAAAQDETEVAVDIDHDGNIDSLNLNAGAAALGWVDKALTFTSSNTVSVFTFTTDTDDFKYAFLLNPGPEGTYTPLTAVQPFAPMDDSEEPQAGANKVQKASLLTRVLNAGKMLLQWGADVISPSAAYAAATSEETVDNGDGTFTFTQTIDESSSLPHYSGSGGGFTTYQCSGGDGWKHSFPDYNQSGLQIQSVMLTIRAWDVDSNVSNGEFDRITVDGSVQNPEFLQGSNDTWSITNFDVNPGSLLDGAADVWMDINVTNAGWCTKLDYSLLTVNYSFSSNNAPFSPDLSIAPTGCTWDSDDLTVTVIGPTPADPDGHAVTYSYRWLVNTGSGWFDDDFAGRGNHTGDTVPASSTRNGDTWRVEVTPTDSLGAVGTKNTITFGTIGQCNTPPVADAGSNQTVPVNTTFTLDATGSYDADGSISNYQWHFWNSGSWTDIGSSDIINYSLTSTGVYQFRVTVTDDKGATDDDLVFIEVVEATNDAPVAVCQDITVQLDANGNASITASDVDGGSYDPNQGDSISMTVSSNSFNCSNIISSNAVTLTVTDDSGESDSCVSNVTVVDNLAPVPNTASLPQVTGQCSATIPAAPTATDNCAGTVTGTTGDPLSYSVQGTSTVTWTFDDGNGNTSTQTQQVVVQDTVAPTAVAKDITVQLDASGNASIVAGDIDNGSSDNCSIASMTVSPANFNCGNIGANTVTLTVTDNSGNVSTATATVTVQDTIAPTVVTKNITVQLDSEGNGSISVDAVDNGSTDNCCLGSKSISKSSFTCADVGENTVTLTVTDCNGNSSSAPATVTVVDNIAPVVLTQDVVVYLDDCNTSITAVDINAGSHDACGIASLSLDQDSFTCSDIGDNTVTLTVTDNNGNSSSATATVTIPNRPPNVDNAYPSTDCFSMPPDHRMEEISIEGVTDPDGQAVNIEITSITSDEPILSGGCADAYIGENGTAELRVERYGRNGRVYMVNFTASDGQAQSDGSVKIVVPYGPLPRYTCEGVVDDGQNYDAADEASCPIVRPRTRLRR